MTCQLSSPDLAAGETRQMAIACAGYRLATTTGHHRLTILLRGGTSYQGGGAQVPSINV